MRSVLWRLCMAGGLVVGLSACGIKGNPRPPRPPPVTETAPPTDPARGAVAPVGPTVPVQSDGGIPP
ncbi:hypothetical protein JGU66_02105 [Myxococcaceae bacterium JPH2]|nr:hypothetical protein [Myxococcaceae bacterium JPH2]